MEILPDVHRIQSEYRGRIFCSYLLAGENALLVDSGFAFTPDDIILPYIKRLGLPLDRIQWLVNTHASGDHHGGNHVIKKNLPQIKIVAHENDAPQIADYETFITMDKGWTKDYGLSYPSIAPDDLEFVTHHGRETPVDLVVKGGESIQIEQDWDVTLIFTPGHTRGHLAVFDEKSRVVFLGDAILGAGVPDLSGSLVMPPHYFEVDWYLRSIAEIHALAPKALLATHYEPILGEKQVEDFLDESVRFVEDCKEMFIHIFDSTKSPLDASTIKKQIREMVGIPDAENQYNLLVRAHLNDLMKQNRIAKIVDDGKITWQMND
jgi:glyoxylase-like metal-dependent hydrolase (beta-lactamase superfamily II)